MIGCTCTHDSDKLELIIDRRWKNHITDVNAPFGEQVSSDGGARRSSTLIIQDPCVDLTKSASSMLVTGGRSAVPRVLATPGARRQALPAPSAPGARRSVSCDGTHAPVS